MSVISLSRVMSQGFEVKHGTKLIVAYHNFVGAPEKVNWERIELVLPKRMCRWTDLISCVVMTMKMINVLIIITVKTKLLTI
jgi:3-dehydroquinate dehydratase